MYRKDTRKKRNVFSSMNKRVLLAIFLMVAFSTVALGLYMNNKNSSTGAGLTTIGVLMLFAWLLTVLALGTVSITKEVRDSINSRSKDRKKKRNVFLIIIGVVIMLSGSGGGALGGILYAGGFVVILIGFGVPLGRKKSSNSIQAFTSYSGDLNTIEGSVKLQLHCYKGFKSKYPKEDPTEIYVRVLAERPGYDREAIKSVLEEANSGAAHGKYNFQSVVTSMLMREHIQDHGDIPNEKIREIVDTTEHLIPPNI